MSEEKADIEGEESATAAETFYWSTFCLCCPKTQFVSFAPGRYMSNTCSKYIDIVGIESDGNRLI